MLKSAKDVQGELHLVRHFLQLPAMAQDKLQRAYENEHQTHPKLQYIILKVWKRTFSKSENSLMPKTYEADQKLQQCQKRKRASSISDIAAMTRNMKASIKQIGNICKCYEFMINVKYSKESAQYVYTPWKRAPSRSETSVMSLIHNTCQVQ